MHLNRTFLFRWTWGCVCVRTADIVLCVRVCVNITYPFPIKGFLCCIEAVKEDVHTTVLRIILVFLHVFECNFASPADLHLVIH